MLNHRVVLHASPDALVDFHTARDAVLLRLGPALRGAELDGRLADAAAAQQLERRPEGGDLDACVQIKR